MPGNHHRQPLQCPPIRKPAIRSFPPVDPDPVAVVALNSSFAGRGLWVDCLTPGLFLRGYTAPVIGACFVVAAWTSVVRHWPGVLVKCSGCQRAMAVDYLAVVGALGALVQDLLLWLRLPVHSGAVHYSD